jgi:hypothetical protein
MEPIRAPLRDLANGRCLYCEHAVDSRFQIDHFIPWVRYANNGIENLVVAHSGCNGSKSDYLAASEHVEKWIARATEGASDLLSVATAARWENHPDRSLGVARSIYLRLPDDLRLWQGKGEFVLPDRVRLVGAFDTSWGVAT